MKNSKWFLTLIVIAAVIGFTLTGCNSPTRPGGGGGNESGDDPLSITYTGINGSDSYTLKITENKSRAYLAQVGDFYILNVNGQISNGKIITSNAGLLTLRPDNSTITFTAKISGSNLIELTGTITWSDNTTSTGPGAFTDNGDTGPSVTLTFADKSNVEIGVTPINGATVTIDWGDGSSQTVTDGASFPHTYLTKTSVERHITITGNLLGLAFYNLGVSQLDLSSMLEIQVVRCDGNLLEENALNVLFNSLPDRSQTTQGEISVSYNPGSKTCNKSIAEGKNYQVIDL